MNLFMICKVFIQRSLFTDSVNVSIPFLTVCRFNPEGSISGVRLGKAAHRLVLQTINAQPDNMDINLGPTLCPWDTVFQNQRGSGKVPSLEGDGLTWITPQSQNTMEKEKNPRRQNILKEISSFKKENKKPRSDFFRGPQSKITKERKANKNPPRVKEPKIKLTWKEKTALIIASKRRKQQKRKTREAKRAEKNLKS